ncbi:hypothetical protein SLS62_010348 [Diatrype stigma]|uniref:DUF3752 domain-containing protein n=1 Tax=Diatrype stigma TaxID=117547 RepID=A0AAN9YIG1_9PEZI
MASIGPQLPPSLTKRKRDPDNDSEGDAPDSPPTKVPATKQSRVGNENAISLGDENSSDDDDDDDDDGFGPSAAAAPAPRPAAPQARSKPSIGPTLPAAVAAEAANADEIALDSEDDDDDDVGPAPAPRPAPSSSTAAAAAASHNPTTGPSVQAPAPAPAPTTKRVHGPAPPPAPLSEKPNDDPDASSDDTSDDDDDGYGPALPTSNSHRQRHAQAERLGVFSSALQNGASAESSKPKRDDWMLAPPSAGSGPRAPDPTKLKSRGFATGPRAGNGGGDGEISSIWTETPEEKRRRLENAVLGRGDGGGGSGGSGSGSSAARRTTTVTTTTMMAGTRGEGQQDRIRDYTESTRGRSLYEEHQLGKKTAKDPKKGKGKEEEEEEEDDPSKRAFDKEKDMKLGGRIGTAQRRELLTRAADFGGRFAKGKYL